MLPLVPSLSVGIASAPLFFADQLVDHFSVSGATYTQRFYRESASFGGPGSPIFLIVGGEGAIPPSVGLFYPFVVDVLAPSMRALVIQPEHRFYGESLPLGRRSVDATALSLLTPQQALADCVRLVRAEQAARNCSLSRTSQNYCPVFSFGGSYPGFLSAMLRLRYPAVIDGAYAASAPVRIYAQQVQQYAYYQVVTRSAERAVSGCSAGVAKALKLVAAADSDTLLKELRLCTPLPGYMSRGGGTLREELLMVFRIAFANLNMANYPPSPTTGLAVACGRFAAAATAAELWAALRALLAGGDAARNGWRRDGHDTQQQLAAAESKCFSLSGQLPAGPNGTVSCGDWSGCGTGADGRSWDFETCSLLVEPIGTNGVTDMFPPREWTDRWLATHCRARFGVTPSPRELVSAWGFDREGLLAQGASRILFTNGLNDGWSAGGFLTNLSVERDLLVLNMENGAHHSELGHSRPCPSPGDTPDVLAARAQAATLLERWRREVKAESAGGEGAGGAGLSSAPCPPRPPLPPPLPGATAVAAVGDSITAGYLSSCGQSYPHQLQRMLGPAYRVTNFGVGGTTLLRKGDHPYWNTSAFASASASNADVVVLMLGTNDAKRWQWPKLHGEYEGDYGALISVFKRMPSKPAIFLMRPPPLYRDGVYGMLQVRLLAPPLNLL